MSCDVTTRAMESSYENFLEAMDTDPNFRLLVEMNLYSHEALWIEKEYGRPDENEESEIFEMLWEYDAEGMFYDCKYSTLKYIIFKREKMPC
jgi:hypothetical protein